MRPYEPHFYALIDTLIPMMFNGDSDNGPQPQPEDPRDGSPPQTPPIDQLRAPDPPEKKKPHD